MAKAAAESKTRATKATRVTKPTKPPQFPKAPKPKDPVIIPASPNENRLVVRVCDHLDSLLKSDPDYIDGGTRPGSGPGGLLRRIALRYYGYEERPDGSLIKVQS